MFPAFLSTVLLAAAADPGPAPPPFTFEDGDRVVLIGNTLIEREQRSGYWEAALTARFPHKNITFRNLGWSGDNVLGIARNSFDASPAGFNRLRDGVIGLKPTVIVVAYGGNESFDGPTGLPKFTADYEKLLDALAPTKARLILLAPPRHEKFQPPLPDPVVHNKDLRLYGEAIGDIATKRKAVFVDLFNDLEKYAVFGFTDNGIHFTETGYYLSSQFVWSFLPKPADAIIDFKELDKAPETKGVRVSPPTRQGDTLRFAVIADLLPTPALSPDKTDKEYDPAHPKPYLVLRPVAECVVRFHNLPPGRYKLLIDGKQVSIGDEKKWAEGITLDAGPDFAQAEQLRAAIIEKNRLYFHRWRPENETYLFGFRKHEQGQNAREVPLFEPLVVKAEEEIARLRVPAPHLYELTKEAGK